MRISIERSGSDVVTASRRKRPDMKYINAVDDALQDAASRIVNSWAGRDTLLRIAKNELDKYENIDSIDTKGAKQIIEQLSDEMMGLSEDTMEELERLARKNR